MNNYHNLEKSPKSCLQSVYLYFSDYNNLQLLLQLNFLKGKNQK